MKWFKHMTASARDEKIALLEAEFGLEGIGFYWRVLEIIAGEMDANLKTSVRFPAKIWAKLFGISAKKFQNLAEFCENVNLFSLKIEGDLVTIDCPKLLTIKDERTSKDARNMSKSPDKVRTKSGLDIDVDIELNNTPLTPLSENRSSEPDPRPSGEVCVLEKPSDDFLGEPEIEFQELRIFYSENARQEGPLAGYAEYRALNKRKLFNFASVMQGVLRLKEHDSEWIRGYAPGLAKFLRERGWEKEATAAPKTKSSRAHIIAAARGESYAEN